MRGKVVFRPGAGGLVTDAPDTFLKPESLVYSSDAIMYRGTLEQRRGWAYEASDGVINQWTAKPPFGTFTVTIASPGVCTRTAHGLVVGDRVYLTTTGALPTGLSANTWYVVVAASFTANTFTLGNSPGGSAINTTGVQSGVHSFGSDGNPVGLCRAKYLSDQAIQTLVTLHDGTIYYSGDLYGGFTGYGRNLGAPVRTSVGGVLPRCMYRDEMIFCYGDGKTPILRYAGSGGKYSFAGQSLSGNTVTYTQNEATVTVSSPLATAPPSGSYIQLVVGGAVATWGRVQSGATTTKLTIANITHSALVTSAYATGKIYNEVIVSGSWPCVSIYNDGVCTVTKTPYSGGGATYVATGTGTVWNNPLPANDIQFETPFPGRTALSYYNKSDRLYYLRTISAINSATSMDLATNPVTFTDGGGGGSIGAASLPSGSAGTPVLTEKAPYNVLSAPTWTDATVHKGSLWGTGVTQHKNRVYVAPPNWDPAFPPGETVPYDVSLNPTARVVTVTIASPSVFTLNGHGFSSGDFVYLSTTGALPTGFTAGTKYYLIDAGLTTTAFQLSATVNGAAINGSGSQSGVHTVANTLNTEFSNADAGKWTLDYLDVPSTYDGDPVTALLSSSGPLLVLKRSGVFGIYGTFPTFDVSVIQTGCGCVDRTAAITVGGAPFWAGETGIWTYRGGRVVSLVEGKIEREWRGLLNGWVEGTSYCTLGVVSDHLVVSVGGLNSDATVRAKNGPDASNPTTRVLVYDLTANEWVSRFSNVTARGFWSARVPGEVEALLFVGQASTGIVGDLTPAFTGVRCAYRDTPGQDFADAASTDSPGGGPVLEVWSSLGVSGVAGVDGEARLVDMSLVTNLYDTDALGSNIDVSVQQGEGLHAPAATPTTVSVGTLYSDVVDAVNRYRLRVGRSGRTHQFRLKTNTTGTNCKKVEIQELVFNFRDARPRS